MKNKVLFELCDSAAMPVHPVTGSRSLFWGRDGRPVWPIAGGSEDGDGGDGKSGTGDGGKGGDGKGGDGKGGDGGDGKSGTGDGGDGKDKGYPANTRVEEMTAPQQAAYHRDQANRYKDQLRGFGKYTPDQVKELQKQYDALVKTGQTDQERAVSEAREAAREEARREAAPQLVESAFTAAAAGRLTADQIGALVEDVDPMKYIGDDGKVDRDKIAAKVEKLAGPVRGGKGPDFGQGRRRDVQQSGREAGREAAARRFGDRARSASKS